MGGPRKVLSRSAHGGAAEYTPAGRGVCYYPIVTKPHANRPKRGPKDRPAPAGPNRLYWLLGILALTFAVYIPSLDNDFTNWDDTHLVTENRAVLQQDAHAILTEPVIGNYI